MLFLCSLPVAGNSKPWFWLWLGFKLLTFWMQTKAIYLVLRAHKVLGTSLMLTWSSSEHLYGFVCASWWTCCSLSRHSFGFLTRSTSVSPLLLLGYVNWICAPAFSLLDLECVFIFLLQLRFLPSAPKSWTQRWVGTSLALQVNKTVDWRLRTNSTAPQLEEERNLPVFLIEYLSFYSLEGLSEAFVLHFKFPSF